MFTCIRKHNTDHQCKGLRWEFAGSVLLTAALGKRPRLESGVQAGQSLLWALASAGLYLYSSRSQLGLLVGGAHFQGCQLRLPGLKSYGDGSCIVMVG